MVAQPGEAAADYGRALQIDPMKPMLKVPGTKRLKLKLMDCFETLLSILACAATLRAVEGGPAATAPGGSGRGQRR